MLKVKKISDYVYDEIFKDIVELKYKPGEKISEVMLAKAMGVSRAPIKSALAKLEKEGLVSIKPQYGTFISKISAERAGKICDIRILLETYAVRIAAIQITEQQLDEFQNLFNALDKIPDDAKEEKQHFIYDLDNKLHNTIYEVGGNEIIREIIDRYKLEIQRIQRVNMTWMNRKESTQIEMRKLFEALKNHDADAAEKAMNEHITNIKNAISSL